MNSHVVVKPTTVVSLGYVTVVSGMMVLYRSGETTPTVLLLVVGTGAPPDRVAGGGVVVVGSVGGKN